MKRVIIILICLVTLMAVCINAIGFSSSGINDIFETDEASQQTIEKKVIRFHVIANSDSNEDQALKLKVRDKVLEYIYPKLKDSKNLDESRNILKENDEEIKKVAQDVIMNSGYNYSVNTTLDMENFPIKSYGNITLPQGKYEAYRIIIGSGEGRNWWCVMFPPLCFIDITKGQVANTETEKEMKRVLTDKEYKLIDNTSSQNKSIQVRFKAVDMIKKILWKK